MKEIWSWVQLAVTAIGGALGYFLGGFDGLLATLIACILADYLTGVLRAISEKKLSSRVGAHGIVKKVAIVVIVGISNMVDIHLLGGGSALRTAVLFFYISNEAISLLENSAAIGLPIPEQLKKVLAQLHSKSTEATPTEPTPIEPTPIPAQPEPVNDPIEQQPTDPGTPQKTEEGNDNDS